MPDTPLILPTPQRPDYEATWAELARFGTTAGDAYNVAGSAYDGVVDLESRTDLLEGVQGYGNLSAIRNQWVVADNYLPFQQQIGPKKGVNLVTIGSGSTSYGGFQLITSGLWRVDAYSLVSDTPFGGANWADLEIEVRRPDHSVYERKRFTIITGANESTVGGTSAIGTVGGCHSFVAPTAGYMVFVLGRAGRWRRYMGGTLYSTLSINKWDSNVTAQAPGTVGDSPYPT